MTKYFIRKQVISQICTREVTESENIYGSPHIKMPFIIEGLFGFLRMVDQQVTLVNMRLTYVRNSKLQTCLRKISIIHKKIFSSDFVEIFFFFYGLYIFRVNRLLILIH